MKEVIYTEIKNAFDIGDVVPVRIDVELEGWGSVYSRATGIYLGYIDAIRLRNIRLGKAVEVVFEEDR